MPYLYCPTVPVHAVNSYCLQYWNTVQVVLNIQYNSGTGTVQVLVQYCTSMNTLLYDAVQIHSMQYNSSIQVGAKLVNTPRRRRRYGINFL